MSYTISDSEAVASVPVRPQQLDPRHARIPNDAIGLHLRRDGRLAQIVSPSFIASLVAQIVKDLVAGSGLVFEDAGEQELKGIPPTAAAL